jgi:hypothetical protein
MQKYILLREAVPVNNLNNLHAGGHRDNYGTAIQYDWVDVIVMTESIKYFKVNGNKDKTIVYFLDGTDLGVLETPTEIIDKFHEDEHL